MLLKQCIFLEIIVRLISMFDYEYRACLQDRLQKRKQTPNVQRFLIFHGNNLIFLRVVLVLSIITSNSAGTCRLILRKMHVYV